MLKKYFLPSPHSPSPIYREPVHRRFIRLLTTEIDAQKSTQPDIHPSLLPDQLYIRFFVQRLLCMV